MSEPTVQDRLRALMAEGLTFGDCVNAFGVGAETDPHASAAIRDYEREGELEIANPTDGEGA